MTDPGARTRTDPDEVQLEQLLAELTPEERFSLTAGRDAWHTRPVPRLGIPALKLTDGPHGARGERTPGATSVSFPCGTALGATWDVVLVREVGAAIAREALRKGARVLLAPTVNAHRHPLAGRNFESYSEDPFLSSRMAVAFIEGVQGEGVAATVKHFVCNDSEFERMTISSNVRERALREIYLPPFEAAVRKAGVWALMAAYNRVNGIYASEHEELIDGLLKTEWGFDGLVVSDWWGTRSTVAAANAGLDLEMPGPGQFFDQQLREAVASGDVASEVVDDKVRRLLRLASRTRAFGTADDEPERSIDSPDDRALARRTASEAVVLLHNPSDVLPLPVEGTLAVIGPLGDSLCAMGGGSSTVVPHHVVSPLDGIREAVGGNTDVRFEAGCRITRSAPTLGSEHISTEGPEGEPLPGASLEFFGGPDFKAPSVHTAVVRQLDVRWGAGGGTGGIPRGQFSLRAHATLTPDESGPHVLALTSAGLSRLFLDGRPLIDNWSAQQPGESFFGAGSTEVSAAVDLEAARSYALTVEYRAPERTSGVAGLLVGFRGPEPVDGMARSEVAAAAADAAVLVVGLDHEWETEGRDRESLSLPGAQDELIARVAAVNPRTIVVINAGSPVAMPWIDDVAGVLHCWFPGQEGGHAIADVLFGRTDPGGRLPTTFPVRLEDVPTHLTYPGEAGAVSYGEEVFVGYRGFDRRAIEPLFPFGHGLSYTAFEYGPVTVSPREVAAGESVTVRLAVQNIGHRAGRTVVQLYVHDAESSLLRPDQELKGFEKVTLAPGERREIELLLDERAFAAWHPRAHDWVVEPGTFEVRVGTSARDIRGRAMIVVR